jgi:hypothetical protein
MWLLCSCCSITNSWNHPYGVPWISKMAVELSFLPPESTNNCVSWDAEIWAQCLLYMRPCLTFSNSTFCPHGAFMCFLWIWEQTAIIYVYNINWLVFITETECVYCAVRTGSLYIIQVMCFEWISEQTAIVSLYNINWLVFITEMECVYCAVRTGSLYIIQVMCFVWIWEQTAIISIYSINWLVCITETQCLLRGTDWIYV